MKNIIVGIDFSESSFNANRNAISIAQKSGANMYLVWVKTPGITLGLLGDHSSEFEKVAQRKLTELVAETQKQLPNNKVEYRIREGKASKELVAAANEMNADLLVVGKHGMSGVDELFIGSNAIKVIERAKCNVLTLCDNGINHATFNDIIIPIDSTKETMQKMPTAIRFAKLFAAKLHILGLYSSELNDIRHLVDAYVNKAVEFTKAQGVRCDAVCRDTDNICDSTIQYADELKAHLIIAMTEQENSISDFWLGSQVNRLVNKAEYPILLVHPDNSVFSISK